MAPVANRPAGRGIRGLTLARCDNREGREAHHMGEDLDRCGSRWSSHPTRYALVPFQFGVSSHLIQLDRAYFCAYDIRMEIVWDLEKAAVNPKRHEGVTFEEAKQVLFDPFALTHEDLHAENEQRFVTLGMGSKDRILVVVYTYGEETIRLISAWKANEPQRRRYEEQFR